MDAAHSATLPWTTSRTPRAATWAAVIATSQPLAPGDDEVRGDLGEVVVRAADGPWSVSSNRRRSASIDADEKRDRTGASYIPADRRTSPPSPAGRCPSTSATVRASTRHHPTSAPLERRHVRRFTDRARRVVVLAEEEAASPNHSHSHRAHPARADPRGRGRRRQGPREPGHLARGRAQPGRGDHRPGRPVAVRPHPLHPDVQEGPRASRSGEALQLAPQLHRHRADPAPASSARREGVAAQVLLPQARCRPVPGPPQVIQLRRAHQGPLAAPGQELDLGAERRRLDQGRPASDKGSSPYLDESAVTSRSRPGANSTRSSAVPACSAWVMQILSRRRRLPGADRRAGVGKTAIVEGLAEMIVTTTCPTRCATKQLETLDLWRPGRRLPRPW